MNRMSFGAARGPRAGPAVTPRRVQRPAGLARAGPRDRRPHDRHHGARRLRGRSIVHRHRAHGLFVGGSDPGDPPAAHLRPERLAGKAGRPRGSPSKRPSTNRSPRGSAGTVRESPSPPASRWAVRPRAPKALPCACRTEGFTILELYLVQEGIAGPRTYYLPLTLAEGAWRTLKVPFSAFAPTESAPPFDPAKPVALEAHLSFQDNWEAYHFRQGAGMAAVLLADDVGYWRSKQPAEATILESFDDERDLLPFSVVLYGSSLWVDYTKTDQGELKLNDAVRAQRLRVEKRSGGQAGPGPGDRRSPRDHPGHQGVPRCVAGARPVPQGPDRAAVRRPGAAARAISFWVRSDVVRGGSLEIQDEPNDRVLTAHPSRSAAGGPAW
ncbi:MAG: hypothetical protein MZW92_02350 [Comamonadaceae bacterium]|nr:hypothetical protein [Comamonadaceae bacterium]